MSAFDRLHPALRYHIVNSLGWRELRPLQELSIEPLLAGEHALLLAPTAGGKTESAIFPLFSRVLEERWSPLSILYLCPLKALLNNLEERLGSYGRLLGLRVGLWHGDIGAGEKKRFLAEPPDLLLTTPESLEVLLLSVRAQKSDFLRSLRAVVVDEIHAFAGDDRGWHVLSLLDRVCAKNDREIQRIGLSATLGNPVELLRWFVPASDRGRRVIAPPAPPRGDADVQLDYVGSLENASLVLSRLHRGEKRLVFVDSRSKVESLAALLRAREIDNYVSHSSLGLDERRRAEEAFANATDAVIVATSTLELGIDVGNLDRVVQIDAPSTVASFLQRLGRTGRRDGARRNCLFLATEEEKLLQAAALLHLWEQGFVEPIVPPAEPWHVFAQQLLALVLQERSLPRHEWKRWIGRVPAFAAFPDEEIEALLAHLIAEAYLVEDDRGLAIGPASEARFGKRNYLDLYSVFDSPPLFTVFHGRQELGLVHESTFAAGASTEARVLLLAGKSWQVNHLDFARRLAYVEPCQLPGKSKWRGTPAPLSFALCQGMLTVLAGDEISPRWSQRAREALARLRTEYPHAAVGRTTWFPSADDGRWETWAGGRANQQLAAWVERETGAKCRADNTAVLVARPVPLVELLRANRGATLVLEPPPVGPLEREQLKFGELLGEGVLRRELGARACDAVGVEWVLGAETRVVGPGA
ncbi:MAG: DEAD/DEAH box helicase [Planctomycetes bacterium]|nr:DEAD/DEAH box helicase [Planctomycetota bacterium]